LSQKDVAQVVKKLHSDVFGCATWRIEFRSTFRNALQQLVAPLQCITPPATFLVIFKPRYKRMREFIIFSETIWGRGVTLVKNIESC